MLAEEVTCILLPQELTYVDGALVACGFGEIGGLHALALVHPLTTF